MLNIRRLFLFTILSIATLVPTSSNSMGLLKATGSATTNTAYWLVQKALRFAHYKDALTISAGYVPAQIMQKDAKPLAEILERDDFKAIAPQIKNITTQLNLNLESIPTCLATIIMGTCVAPTVKGNVLILARRDFEDANDTQKVALIGHELVHIKDNAGLKQSCTSWATPLALDVASIVINKLFQQRASSSLLTTAGLAVCNMAASSLAMRTIMRHYEKHADIVSAKYGNCAQGAINFFEKLQQQKKESLEKASLFSRLRRFISEFFDGHPSLEERIKYLTPIAQAQAAAAENFKN